MAKNLYNILCQLVYTDSFRSKAPKTPNSKKSGFIENDLNSHKIEIINANEVDVADNEKNSIVSQITLLKSNPISKRTKENKNLLIPKNMPIDLSKTLCALLGASHISNTECEEIILKEVLSEAEISSKDFEKMRLDLFNHDPFLIFNRRLFGKKYRFNAYDSKEVARNLIEWIRSKGEILAKHRAQQEDQKLFDEEREKAAREYFQKQSKEIATKKLEIEKANMGAEEDWIKTLPQEIQDWYHQIPNRIAKSVAKATYNSMCVFQ